MHGGALPPEGLQLDLLIHRRVIGAREVREGGRWVKRPRYEVYSFNVFAFAYDRESRALWAGSAYVTVSPEQYEYAVEVRARRYSSRQVSGSEVPEPGQYAQLLDRQATDVVILACSVPAGARCWYKIPAGASVPIQT